MRVILLLVALGFSGMLQAQVPKKYAIGQSGCSAYFFCDPGKFERSFSEDSSDIYQGGCIGPDSLEHTMILVKLKEAINSMDDAEAMMVAYIDYLKATFDLKKCAGYGKGHTLQSKPEARGVIDYCSTPKGEEWKLKGWTDGRYIAVMMVVGIQKEHNLNRLELFLNGFRFPE